MFKKIFIQLCNKKGVAPTVACCAVGLSDAAFSKWTDKSVPRKATLVKIADYFGVSVDYLLGKEEQPSEDRKTPLSRHPLNLQLFAEQPSPSSDDVELINLSGQEKALVKTFRGTTEEGRMKIIQATMNICDEIESKNRVILYEAASSEDHHKDRYITKDKEKWSRIEGTPNTDDPLV